jgi:type III pantothenate kinase
MSLLLVADIGNSRMKWGRCAADRVIDAVALPLDEPSSWEQQLAAWDLGSNTSWFLAAVNPGPLTQLATFLANRGHPVRTLQDHQGLPLQIDVEQPQQVGLDRLLNAVAFLERPADALPAILVDAGSAVTVDLVDRGPVFRGGAIFPGLRLMVQALHGYTARLPLVSEIAPQPFWPGRSTEAAIRAGIHAAVVGGVCDLVRSWGEQGQRLSVYLTGGDGPLLSAALEPRLTDMGLSTRAFPWMTLEGLRIVAQRSLERSLGLAANDG